MGFIIGMNVATYAESTVAGEKISKRGLMKLFSSTMDALEKSLDLHLKRHTLLTGNIANSETPNYRARELDFAGALHKAIGQEESQLRTTHSKHVDASFQGEPHVVFDNSSAMGSDGNNVDLDLAMGKLSSNARVYSSASNYLNLAFRTLRTVVRAGQGG